MGRSDPATTTAMDVINSWALFVATSDIDGQLVETTWARVAADLLARQQSTWSHRIWGICSATACLLLRYSWGAHRPVEVGEPRWHRVSRPA
eukprot:2620672-Pyramimonas_sp.AAC.1